VDVEAEAAALLADQDHAAEDAAPKTIDFNCPSCEAPLQLDIELAGKKTSCPECRRIIKVPELAKKDPKNWRKVEPKGPIGAKKPEEEVPEGAWGSTAARKVSTQALVEAAVIPKVKKPQTLAQKLRWPVLGGVTVLVLSVAGLLAFNRNATKQEENALKRALDFAASETAIKQVRPENLAALNVRAGEYYLNMHNAQSGQLAKEQFDKALSLLAPMKPGSARDNEHDAVLTDAVLALAQLGGDKDAVYKGLKAEWKATQTSMMTALKSIHSPEARLDTLREVTRKLIGMGEARRVIPLALQVYPNPGADQAEAKAVVGLELARAGNPGDAEKYLNEAMAIYGVKGARPQLRAPVVALALTLNKKPPEPGKPPVEAENELLGQVEVLARQGKTDEAIQKAATGAYPQLQLRVLVAAAAGAVDSKSADKVLDAAVKLVQKDLQGKKELSWALLHLINLGAQAGYDEEGLRSLASAIADESLKGRAQLTLLRQRLGQTKQTVEETELDKVDGKSLSRALAREELARHNVRASSGYAKVVQGWPDLEGAFGALGVARGMESDK
jgi:hypothetical protein